MTIKTYFPGLRLIFKGAHKYATRYQTQLRLRAVMTDAQYTCLLDGIQALASCLAAFGETPIVGNS